MYIDSRCSLQKYLCMFVTWAQQASVDQLISQMVDQFRSSGQLAALETASDQQKAAICRCNTKYKMISTVSMYSMQNTINIFCSGIKTSIGTLKAQLPNGEVDIDQILSKVTQAAG